MQAFQNSDISTSSRCERILGTIKAEYVSALQVFNNDEELAKIEQQHV